jgi:osmotically-inducible protein OsmY
LSAAVAAASICGAAACVSPPKSQPEQAADAATSDTVRAAFDADQMLYARHITVRSDNGVVTLGGYAWTPVELQAARRDAQRVPGVVKVVDRIQIDRGAVGGPSITR